MVETENLSEEELRKLAVEMKESYHGSAEEWEKTVKKLEKGGMGLTMQVAGAILVLAPGLDMIVHNQIAVIAPLDEIQKMGRLAVQHQRRIEKEIEGRGDRAMGIAMAILNMNENRVMGAAALTKEWANAPPEADGREVR